jgi:hypothetical protein
MRFAYCTLHTAGQFAVAGGIRAVVTIEPADGHEPIQMKSSSFSLNTQAGDNIAGQQALLAAVLPGRRKRQSLTVNGEQAVLQWLPFNPQVRTRTGILFEAR